MTELDLHTVSSTDLAKLEGRMDAGFAQLAGKLDTFIARQEAADKERDMDRNVAEKRYDDHERRLRILEERKTVTPRALWTAVISGITGLIGVVTLIGMLAEATNG